ncbi:MAG TPA: amidase family protein [Bacilli bacterium]|nr:amidase family protein [Bacilli bacterium]
MKKYSLYSVAELHDLLIKREVTPLELVQEAIRLLKEDENNVLEASMEKEALEAASSLGEPQADAPFWGIPVLVKDNYSTQNVESTASSDILNGYRPVFDAEVVARLKKQGAVLIGKTTLDELAMGGSGTTGHKGITYNPWDKKHERMMGGSSCGSAAAVAAGIVPFALGSDTGDSVRKPASFGGLVGFKPTWGRISRFGLFPFAPSLDHVGYFTRSVLDAALALEVLAGRDDKDATSSSRKVEKYSASFSGVKGKELAVIDNIVSSIKDKQNLNDFNSLLDKLAAEGAHINHVKMDAKLLNAIYPTYIVISCAEATSNNANLDGVKFGPRFGGSTYEEVMTNARTKGFSELIKRRFVIGSFALMKENQEVLFLRAQKARKLIVDAVNSILADNDSIILPAAPSIAPLFHEDADKLSDTYLVADNHLALGNFAGLPSITIPLSIEKGMPLGINIMGRPFEESTVLSIALVAEQITGLKGLCSGRDE